MRWRPFTLPRTPASVAKVALKILRPEQAQDETFRARFKREAEAVASLNNPCDCCGV